MRNKNFATILFLSSEKIFRCALHTHTFNLMNISLEVLVFYRIHITTTTATATMTTKAKKHKMVSVDFSANLCINDFTNDKINGPKWFELFNVFLSEHLDGRCF